MQVLNSIYADVAAAHTRVQYIDVSTSLGSADGGFSPAVNGFADEFHLNALGYCNLFRHTPGLTDAFGCTASSTADPGCTLAPTPAAVTPGPTVMPSPAPTTSEPITLATTTLPPTVATFDSCAVLVLALPPGQCTCSNGELAPPCSALSKRPV